SRDGEGQLVGGLSLLSGYINKVRAQEKNVIYAIAGDMLQGSMIDTEFKGLSTFEIMNYLAPDVVTLGNHELDYGFPHLLFLEKMANFPIVNANLYIKKYSKRLMRPYLILNVDGFDIMFIGILTEEVLKALKLDTSIGTFINLEDAVTEVGKICNAYKNEDIDLTVLLTHIGFEEDKKLAALLNPEWGVDLIIGGHSHTLLEQPVEVNGILIAQAAVGTDQIGRFDISVDDDSNSIVDWKWQLVPINNQTCEPDLELESFIATYKEAVDRKYNRILARLARKLSHPRRESETELGNLFADIFAEQLEADVVLVGSGSIRSQELGPVVTLGRLKETFAFDGPLYKFQVSGALLLRIFAHLLRAENRIPGQSSFCQVNHAVRAVYSEANQRLESLHIHGSPVEADKSYSLCLQDYAYLSPEPSLGVTGQELGAPKLLSTSSQDVLQEFLSTHQLLDSHVENRLSIV
ncbi:MAG: bifunctional UDP-sugar hydrolase/5'-nucleotidase, partial [Candidatus Sericytochromatia bacterium]